MASICVYCGSSPGNDPAFREAAMRLGVCLAEGGHTLVYGGGKLGLMGAVADAALSAGGEVVGIIPEMLVKRELAHGGLTTLHTVLTMHERKFRMASMSDVFIAMPGGIGTLEEIIEIFVWAQLGVHSKPCAILNVSGFYDPLLNYLEHMASAQFLSRDHLSQLIVSDRPEVILSRALSYSPFPKTQRIEPEKID
jgi:uncharacterized protein (TIGR00730 family)